tara:strand:- start:558 stop:1727 length:1170 start_codon:yes stop_codon:yes gene_type:complete
MLKKTYIACLTLFTLSAQAQPDILSCDNYKEKILSQSLASIDGGEIDCSADRAQSHISYISTLSLAQPEQSKALSNTKNFFNTSEKLILSHEQYPQQYLIDRFLPEVRVQNRLNYFKNSNSYMYRHTKQYYGNWQTNIDIYLPQLPGMSLAENLDLLDGNECSINEVYNPFSNPLFGLRDWEAIHNETSPIKAWYIGSCSQSSGKLIVQNTEQSSSTSMLFELPHINHDFANISEEIGDFSIYRKFCGMTDDGRTILLQNIDDTNIYISESTDLDESGSLYTIFQHQFSVLRNNKIYHLPLQKLVQQEIGSWANAVLSADGSHIAVAHTKSVKLFTYNEASDDYVLTGLYTQQDSGRFSPSSLEMSEDGLTLYVDLNHQTHKIEFSAKK